MSGPSEDPRPSFGERVRRWTRGWTRGDGMLPTRKWPWRPDNASLADKEMVLKGREPRGPATLKDEAPTDSSRGWFSAGAGHQLASALEDAFVGWFYSRKWRALLGLIPILTIGLPCLFLVLYGRSIDRRAMLQRYLTWADRESPEVNEILGAPLIEKPETERANIPESKEGSSRFISNFADALLRRSLEFDPTNPQAKYLIAHRLYRMGNQRRARQIFRSIAPADGGGFAPAHAWIAEEMVQQARQGKKLNRDELAHHLNEAIRWPLVSPSALLLHGSFLEGKGEIDEAIQFVKRAAQRQPEYLLILAELARKHQREGIRTVALTNAEAHFREQVKSSKGTEQDLILLAQVLVQQNQLLTALEVLTERIKKDQPPSANLRRAISEVYRLLFLKSVVTDANGTRVQLELLEKALQADPTNPLIAEEVAKLNLIGVEAGEKLLKSLQERLAEGAATSVTHLLIANYHLKQKDYQKAITHLEIAQRSNPDAVVILNNLALALMLKDKSQSERSLELINRCLSLAGPHPEFLDSRGQIYKMMGQYLDAASDFERAIQGDPTRRATREMLIAVYRAAGLPEMAEAHKEILERSPRPDTK